MIKKILATICAIGLVFASCFVGHKIDSKADSINYPSNIQNPQNYYFQHQGIWYYQTPEFEVVFQNTSISSYSSIRVSFLFPKDDQGQPLNYGLIRFGGFFGSSPITSLYKFDSRNSGLSISDATGNLVSGVGASKYQITFFSTNAYTSFWDSTSRVSFEITFAANRSLSFLYKVSAPNSIEDPYLSVSFSVSLYAGATTCYYTPFLSNTLSPYVTVYPPLTSTDQGFQDIYATSQEWALGGIYTQDQYQSYGNQQYNQGQQAGYNKGYSAGISDGGSNSFLSLITAVVDAPVTAFTSLLNFDILGFNVKNVVLSLLTAALVIACIRFFSGKFV